jgi:hypothetical protein
MLQAPGQDLRLWWLWLSKTDPACSWAALPSKEDSTSKAFFLALMSCTLGDGKSTLFWTDPWLDGRCIGSVILELLHLVPAQRRAQCIVASTLQNHAWVYDLAGPLTVLVLTQFLMLRQRTNGMILETIVPHRVI